MCGFSGEVRWDGEEADVVAVSRMTSHLKPRGPDDSGVWANGAVALGHRRLSIIDPSTHAIQPMVDPELGLVVVFNGCIYNHHELRAELAGQGYRFFSNGDTEVLLKAYHHWGKGFVDHLHGMFACCIVERDSGRVVLARDRLGVKPLYLGEMPGGLRFASTLPALLAGGGIDTTVDPVAAHHYLTLHGIIPSPRTIVAGARKLPPATVLVIEPDGAQRRTTYWQPPYTRDPARATMSAGDWDEAVLAELRASVKRRMVADVPVGVLLSGGLDSSVNVALLSEAGVPDLQTFSIGFPEAGGEAGDEFHWSDIVAQRYGTDHHRIPMTAGDLVKAVPGAIQAMAEPMVSHDAVAFYLLSQAVSEHVKVVQSGQGADEVLAGYYWHEPFGAVARADAADEFASIFFDRTHAEVLATLHPDLHLDHDPSRALVDASMGAAGAETALDAVQRLDITRLMPDDPLKRVDSMTMAWGLEARVPFLDHHLVELAALCPPELKLAEGGKGPLKRIGRRVLPTEVVNRPKGYFPVPSLRSLEGPVLDLVTDALTSTAARDRGLFRPEHVDRLLADPNGSRSRGGANFLWQLGVLELWLQEHASIG